VNVYGTAETAGADVLAADFAPTRISALRVTVAISGTNAVLNVQMDDGATQIAPDLNDGTALTVGRLYTFSFGAHTDYTYNFQFESNTTCDLLLVEEIQDGEL